MKLTLSFLTTIFTFLLPIKALILLVIGFVILDTISGVYATIKIKGKKSFRSGILFNIVPKTFLYSSTIILSFLIDKFILGGSLMGIQYLLSKGISVLWIYIEVKSIDENSQKLGYRPFLELIKELFTKLKGVKKDINEICDK